MIPRRHRTELGGARLSQLGKGAFRLRLVLLLIAAPLALALAATLLPRGFSHAADPLPVEWIPGNVQNIQDLSGCHARQEATIKTSTPTLAGQVRDQLNQVKEKDLADHGLKLVSIWKTDVNGATVSLDIETWYNGECPGPSTSAGQPETGSTIQPASFHDADLHTAGLQRAGLLKWVKTAFAAVATGVVYVAVFTLIIGAITAVAPEAATSIVAMLAGCVAGSAASVVGTALFTGDWKNSLIAGVAGCAWGAVLGPLTRTAAALFRETVDNVVGAGTTGWMGQGAAGAAAEAGVELQPVSNVVSATGQEVLRAAQ